MNNHDWKVLLGWNENSRSISASDSRDGDYDVTHEPADFEDEDED